MGSCGDEIAYNGFHIMKPHNCFQLSETESPAWFDVKVFYVRVINDLIDDSTPEFLKLNHIPLHPETLLEVNGTRSSFNSHGISSLLRRDRVDKKSEEVTFVSTDAVRFTATASVKFKVFNKDNLVLTGVLENPDKKWRLRCKSELVGCTSFLKAHDDAGLQFAMPVIEVYAAGCVSGSPIILTERLQLNTFNKNAFFSSDMNLQGAEYRRYKMESGEDIGFYRKGEYMEEEDCELSWFNVGLRAGVGISLGVCLGVGLSVGLMLRTYKTTTRTFRKRFF